MRTLLIFCISLFSSTFLSAKPTYTSQLKIRMADLSTYTVTFNNTTYFATEWVKINNIPPGKHYLRIEENVRSRGYGVRANGVRVIYSGYLTVPPASIVTTNVNFNRLFRVARIERFDCYSPARRGQQGLSYGYGTTRPPVYQNQRPQQQGWDNQDDHDDDYGNDDGYDYDSGDQDYDDGTYGSSKLVAPKAQPKTIDKKQVQPKK